MEQNTYKKLYINKKCPNFKFYKKVTCGCEWMSFICEFDIYKSNVDNEEYIASRKKNHNIEIIKIKDNTIFKTLKEHNITINSCRCFENDKNKNQYLISSDENKIVIVWDIHNDYKILHKIETRYRGNLYSNLILFNINQNDYIITSSIYNGDLLNVYSFDKGNLLKSIKYSKDNGPINKTEYMCFWKNKGNFYLINNCVNCIVVTDLITGNNYAVLDIGKQSSSFRHGFVYKNTQYCASSEQSDIVFWDLINKNVIKHLNFGKVRFIEMALYNDNYIILSDYGFSNIKILDLTQGKIIFNISDDESKSINGVKIYKKSENEFHLFTSGQEGVIKQYISV